VLILEGLSIGTEVQVSPLAPDCSKLSAGQGERRQSDSEMLLERGKKCVSKKGLLTRRIIFVFRCVSCDTARPKLGSILAVLHGVVLHDTTKI
jgi:hypothetical protein